MLEEAIEADAVAAFEEALRLDPFSARMVSAITRWYRQRGYQGDVARFGVQLKQILPETNGDREVPRLSWAFHKRQLIAAFLETADKTLLKGYATGWQEATDNNRYIDELVARADQGIDIK